MLRNKIYIGIGHTGNFHEQCRRDFVPEGGAADRHADEFYGFLQTELLPGVETGYAVAGRSLVGHSFGGLFSCYCLFRQDRLFDTFFALSPSLWVNNYAFFDREAVFAAGAKDLPVYFYLSAGSLEVMNRILSGNRRLKGLLEQRNYSGLELVYEEHAGKTHNSQVSLSMEAVVRHRY